MRRFVFWKTSWFWITTFALVVFFSCFVLTRYTSIFVSPDETANAYFAQTFSQTGKLFTYDALSQRFNDLIHPRSIISVSGRLLPGSFLGLPVLYGAIISVIGEWSLLWLTPFFAFLAVFSWYAILKQIFAKQIAFYGTLLLAIHPAWWYYTSRSLMHNVLFLCLVLFGVFFLVVRPVHTLGKNARWSFLTSSDFAFSAICFGLALFVRPSEVFWLAGAGILTALWFWKKWKRKEAFLFLMTFLIACLPLAWGNLSTYGGVLTFGYTSGQEELSVVQEIIIDPTNVFASARTVWYQVLDFPVIKQLFPFGIHPRIVFTHIFHYVFLLFWWLTIPALFGLVILLFRINLPKEKQFLQQWYFVLFLFVTCWLGIMYGSWTFSDNPDPTQITMANSYVRYWLPIYVLSTPLIALTLHRFSQKAVTASVRKWTVVGVLSVFFLASTYAVFFQGEDSLLASSRTLSSSQQIREVVLDLTEPEALIIVDRADKLFFPYRRVLYPLRSEQTYALMPSVILYVPLYYYGITLPPQDLDYLNTDKLKKDGLFIEVMQTFEEETLYRIGSL
ncbi:MAG: hypothetical protein UU08_C0030G0005 [Candidatus Uhrbacteria bacterium GW2011_GWE2_40_58]|nr:MAG: hypothetical protein UT94_C0041G0004 [Candidatus Uhrbacteria bacterium GW2011_GWF2_40_263]KKR66944.1 MAG: hypothetical protein UU08_C0030G0005 [Candidatus Uhrbacteria bacterium GW2011_GWE2_40_58]OGL92830.1 MAG: hypothetical protein A2239_02680 [Candidatus Uhrbacteria bacterium RIFOXYA2_FULL_40_9]OGL97419.1 MAG: hypothetical protein A2332_04125 [Candidatus Uhrbacteria bacterium RIFOXYB2_FULL_41_18]HBK35222.1 hypothetical protein [Candidatus Uhrbacteria bacterium]